MVCHQVLADFFRTGVYDLRERSLACTISPAIDILVGSKIKAKPTWTRFHRTLNAGFAFSLGRSGWLSSTVSLPSTRWVSSFFVAGVTPCQVFRLSDDEQKLVCPSYIEADWCSEEDCKAEVTSSLSSTDYLLDPHTAVAVAVARRCRTPKVGNENHP